MSPFLEDEINAAWAAANSARAEAERLRGGLAHIAQFSPHASTSQYAQSVLDMRVAVALGGE